MKIIACAKTLQDEMLTLKRQGKTIGFVPTMGNLHAGHLSLITLAKQHCDLVVSSIFVNPMQFGPNEDFDNYPRTLNADIKKLENQQTDYLFTPNEQVIYPLGKTLHSAVEVNRLTDKLCGASRPGHFKGVTTIVNILFNIVQPDIAVFGKKDYQQLQVIKAMVTDLMLPIKIIGAEIAREPDGLAMSSRNGFLSPQEKQQASQLRKIILQAATAVKTRQSFESVIQQATEQLTQSGFKVDYFKVVRQDDLQTAQQHDKNILIAAAAWLGTPRLIDNLELTLDDF